MEARKPADGVRKSKTLVVAAAGRRKTKVRELFERDGAEAAWVLGLRLGLKEGTLRSWFSSWRDEGQRENQ